MFQHSAQELKSPSIPLFLRGRKFKLDTDFDTDSEFDYLEDPFPKRLTLNLQLSTNVLSFIIPIPRLFP